MILDKTTVTFFHRPRALPDQRAWCFRPNITSLK